MVLCELAAGTHPFLRGSLVDTLYAVTRDEPRPLSEVRPDLPRTLQDVIHRLMSKRPQDRFPSLQALWGGLTEDIPTTSRMPCRLHPGKRQVAQPEATGGAGPGSFLGRSGPGASRVPVLRVSVVNLYL